MAFGLPPSFTVNRPFHLRNTVSIITLGIVPNALQILANLRLPSPPPQVGTVTSMSILQMRTLRPRKVK